MPPILVMKIMLVGGGRESYDFSMNGTGIGCSYNFNSSDLNATYDVFVGQVGFSWGLKRASDPLTI